MGPYSAHLSKGVPTEALVLIGLQDAELGEGHHRCLLNTGVGLLAAVGDKLGQQNALVHVRLTDFQFPDLVSTGSQQGHEDALRGRALELAKKKECNHDLIRDGNNC